MSAKKKSFENDNEASQMKIEAFSESESWDLVEEAIEYMKGNL